MDAFAALNQACLRTFGSDWTHTPAGGGTPVSITGIVNTGVEPSDKPTGDGSIYVHLWVDAGQIATRPAKGDVFRNNGHAYTVVDMDEDAERGLLLRLRYRGTSDGA